MHRMPGPGFQMLRLPVDFDKSQLDRATDPNDKKNLIGNAIFYEIEQVYHE